MKIPALALTVLVALFSTTNGTASKSSFESSSSNYYKTMNQNLDSMDHPSLGVNIYKGDSFSATWYKDLSEAIYDGLKLSTYFKYTAECKTHTYNVLDQFHGLYELILA